MPEKIPTIDNLEKLPTGFIERYSNDKVEIVTIGQPLNARLLYSTPAKAEELYPGTSELRKKLLETLSKEAAAHDITTLTVLRVDRFNASITTTDELKNIEPEDIGNGIILLRSDDDSFFHDGVALEPGEGAVIVTGDCHTLTLWSDDTLSPTVIAAHAGRNSLHTISHEHTDNLESVVGSAVEKLGVYKLNIHARITAGIGPDNFKHSPNNQTYGEHNKRLLEYFSKYGGANTSDPDGKIDVAKTIKGQLAAMDIPIDNISWDGLDTSTDNRLWSNKMDDKPRNAILVLNKTKY